MGDADKEVRALLDAHVAPIDVRSQLTKKGFLEDDIERSLAKVTLHPEDRRKARLFLGKEVMDRIGYGMTTPQFINILFFLTGASFFLIGIVNGLKTLLTNLLGSLIKEFQQRKHIAVSVVSSGGVLFGFSFIFLSLGVMLRSPLLFTAALLLSSVGVVTHGEAFHQFAKQQLTKEHMPWMLANIALFGLLFIAVGLLIGGYVMDTIPLEGKTFTLSLFGSVLTFKAYGYLISFEATAVLFIISGYVLSFMKQPEVQQQKRTGFLKEYLAQMRSSMQIWRKNRLSIIATIATLLIVISQIIVNTFVGIFIWQGFRNVGVGGFTNVAIIFVIALFAALLGPYITRSVQLKVGEGPMLVFGALLVALLPITIYSNPNLLAIGLSTCISIIGASLLGTAQGLFMRKLLHKDELEKYYFSLSVLSVIPIIICVPVAAWLAQVYGLHIVMLAATLIIACIAAPLYFAIVWETRKLSTNTYFIDLPDKKKKLTLEAVQQQVS
jgi:hypothetical protein